MPQASIIILDNSNYSINGDYPPTRWLSQIDASVLLIETKMSQSHETAVGIALSGGNQVQIACTPTTDSVKVQSYLYGVKQFGHQKLSNALQTSALALKHRANPNLAQRIICFVASPVTESVEELKLICKKIKKNNIALDLIGIGDLSAGQREKLGMMHETVRSETQNCSLLFVEPQGNVSDVLFTSQILGGEANGPAMMINEDDDPQLRMALEMSLRQEQARLAALAASNNQNPPANQANEEEDLEERALQLSLQEEKKGQKKDEKKDEKKE